MKGGYDKLKISIITSEESFMTNYGAALQGYALSRVATHNDNHAEIIRYLGGRLPQIPINKRAYLSLYNYYRANIKPIIKQSGFRKPLEIQASCFRAFQKEHLSFWNKRRTTWQQLRKHYPVSDIYICGSDQIWNPNYKNGYNDPGYFLDFAPTGKKRIAYAPSFACDDIPVTAQVNLKYYIDKFDAVSVREKEGADIIEKYTGRKVPVVADPTFLLTQNEWNEVATVLGDMPPKYILCYRFMNNDEMKQCIDHLSEMLSLPVISLPLSDISLGDPYIKRFDAGPTDFVGLIRNATLVCTDSFHATAFSLIMNTPFYTFLDNDTSGKGTNMNSRVRNVIGIAGLENRVIREKSEIDIDNPFDIDFSKFNKDIGVFREKSLKWLYDALKGSKDE